MKLSDYTVPELNKYRELCNFSDEEMEYFNLRSRGKSNIQISMTMCVSEPKVSLLARKVRDKIKKVDKLSTSIV